MKVILGLCIAAQLFALGMLWRNSRVYRWQMQILERVRDGARRDIERDQPWTWRYAALDAVPYTAQMVRFWRPLDSFMTPDLRRAIEE